MIKLYFLLFLCESLSANAGVILDQDWRLRPRDSCRLRWREKTDALRDTQLHRAGGPLQERPQLRGRHLVGRLHLVHAARWEAAFRDPDAEGHLRQDQEERVSHSFEGWTVRQKVDRQAAAGQALSFPD